jgi:ABC-type nickel/cobalt efflux system permease component RcnA
MRYVLSIATFVLLAVLAWAWVSGGFDRMGFWAATQQREFQNAIAGALRRVRGGELSAALVVLAACFAYGLAHAVGPGHGKVLIGGYGFARKVPVLRLSLIALAASLGQAVTAVLLVYAGVLVLNLGRETMIDLTEAVMAPASYAAIALIGIWLMVRGVRKLTHRQGADDHAHTGTEEVCSSCGHAHAPTLEQMEQIGTLREALVLIGGVAMRPCTGALFVLIITWQMGIGVLGIAGAFAMALGTALITIFVGLVAGGLRGGVLAGLSSSPQMARAVAGIEFLAGSAVAFLAGGLLLRAL